MFSSRMRCLTMGTAVGISLLTLNSAAIAHDDHATPTPAADESTIAAGEATPSAGVETFDVASADHTTETVNYPQDPPAGGPHDPSWQKCAVYDAPVRPENAVHSQEHGAVWITYQPDLAESDREALAELAVDQPYVLISPYPDLKDPVVASAWGAQLRTDRVDDPQLQAFINRFAGNGPERGARCDTGIESTISE